MQVYAAERIKKSKTSDTLLFKWGSHKSKLAAPLSDAQRTYAVYYLLKDKCLAKNLIRIYYLFKIN